MLLLPVCFVLGHFLWAEILRISKWTGLAWGKLKLKKCERLGSSGEDREALSSPESKKPLPASGTSAAAQNAEGSVIPLLSIGTVLSRFESTYGVSIIMSAQWMDLCFPDIN